MYVTGACWLTVLSSLNTSAQRVAPGWVRARTLASFQLVMQGGLALGSLALGLIAGGAGVRTALLIAAGGLAAGVLGARRWPLGHSEEADLSPAGLSADPLVQIEPGPDDGPVLVTVEYTIDSADAERFVETMEELGVRPPPRRGLPLEPLRGPGAPGAATSRPSSSTRGPSTCASTSASPSRTSTWCARCTPLHRGDGRARGAAPALGRCRAAGRGTARGGLRGAYVASAWGRFVRNPLERQGV